MSKKDIISAVLIDSDDEEEELYFEKKVKNHEPTQELELMQELRQEPEPKRKRIIKPKLQLNACFSEKIDIIEIGIDEVGRGPLLGRVYASAVVLPKSDEFNHSEMKDSKKFHSKSKINATSEYIKQNAIAWSIKYEDETTVDRMNILQATQLAMHSCIIDIIHQLKEKNPELNLRNLMLLIDGNYFKPFTYFNSISNKFETMTYHTIEQGDNKFTSIAAASILAKVERDKYIDELCEENPELKEKYKIDSNKGYGSKHHLDGIKQHGISQWHRKTFGICKNYF
jgi:ribonuclease HII